MEFRKGILFVRLKGKLIKDTTKEFQEDVIYRIQNNGIHNVVINIEELDDLDLKGMNALLYCYESCKKNKGTALLCGSIKDSIKQRINRGRLCNYMFLISNELEALEQVKI